jgi:hypothetical protein
MKEIELTQGYKALVDDADFERCQKLVLLDEYLNGGYKMEVQGLYEPEYWDKYYTQQEWSRKHPRRKVYATLSDTPCKENCWHATGNICICSCGGHNHGIGHEPKEAK